MKHIFYSNLDMDLDKLNQEIKLASTIYPETEELVEEEIATITTEKFPCKVILFNDSEHSFDDVIHQLIKAINCSKQKAEDLAWEVHSSGKACVFEGNMEECLRVTSILDEIALHTVIEM